MLYRGGCTGLGKTNMGGNTRGKYNYANQREIDGSFAVSEPRCRSYPPSRHRRTPTPPPQCKHRQEQFLK